jgi:hypothetical protein
VAVGVIDRFELVDVDHQKRAVQQLVLRGVGVVVEQKTALRRSVLRTVRPVTERSSRCRARIDRQRAVASRVAARVAAADACAPPFDRLTGWTVVQLLVMMNVFTFHWRVTFLMYCGDVCDR